jgi:hypothetical protein
LAQLRDWRLEHQGFFVSVPELPLAHAACFLANPALAAAKKEKNDAKREGRKASGSTKSFA